MSADNVEMLPKEAVMPKLAEMAGTDVFAARDLLWNTYDPYSMWAIFAAIGVGSLLMLMIYNKVVNAANKNPDHNFNLYGQRWVRAFLIPITLAFIYFTYNYPSTDLALNTLFFSIMLIISFMSEIRGMFGPSKSTTG
jgi:cell division protein FtsW (lipid II flippase)